MMRHADAGMSHADAGRVGDMGDQQSAPARLAGVMAGVKVGTADAGLDHLDKDVALLRLGIGYVRELEPALGAGDSVHDRNLVAQSQPVSALRSRSTICGPPPEIGRSDPGHLVARGTSAPASAVRLSPSSRASSRRPTVTPASRPGTVNRRGTLSASLPPSSPVAQRARRYGFRRREAGPMYRAETEEVAIRVPT
jgi:hypothetical protein